MAINVIEPVGETASTNNQTTYTLNSFTPTANSLLVVGVVATDTNDAGSITNTGTTLTWTRRNSVLFNSNAAKLFIFTAPVPSTVSASVITFNCTSDAATGAIMMAHEVTGFNTYSPVAQTSTNTGSGSNPSVTRANANTNNAYILYGGTQGTTTVSSDPSGWTRTSGMLFITPSTAGGSWYREGGETSTSVSYSNSSSTKWGLGYIEINAEGIGPYKPRVQALHIW